jgi:hypothetical protein
VGPSQHLPTVGPISHRRESGHDRQGLVPIQEP